MEVQEPTAQHERLTLFTGNWVGQEIIHPTVWDPKGGYDSGPTEYTLAWFDGMGGALC